MPSDIQMPSDTNPYESPRAADVEIASADIRRSVFETFLIGIWILEGGFIAFVLATGLMQGFNPLQYLAQDYHAWNRLVFFLVSLFFIVETIGPWIGVYYLTGRRSRMIPFHTALFRTLKVAGGLAMVATLLLMLYCELAGIQR